MHTIDMTYQIKYEYCLIDNLNYGYGRRQPFQGSFYMLLGTEDGN